MTPVRVLSPRCHAQHACGIVAWLSPVAVSRAWLVCCERPFLAVLVAVRCVTRYAANFVSNFQGKDSKYLLASSCWYGAPRDSVLLSTVATPAICIDSRLLVPSCLLFVVCCLLLW